MADLRLYEHQNSPGFLVSLFWDIFMAILQFNDISMFFLEDS